MPVFRGSCWFALGVLTAACGGNEDDHASGGRSGATHDPCATCMQSGSGGDSAAGAAPAGASNASSGHGGLPDAGLGGLSETAGVPNTRAEAGASGSAPVVDNELAISEVSFWQAMRIPLELSGAPVLAIAPIVQHKDGILRVYVSPGSSFQARRLTASLEFDADAGAMSLTSTKFVHASSSDADFATSFNFPIEGINVTANASYSVVLRDAASGATLDRYPAVGQDTVSAVSAGQTFDVVVVPIIVAGIAPDVSAPALATFRARLLSMYPLADLTISAHEPVVSNVVVGPDAGWDQLLDALYALRAKDQPADNMYYFGLFTPAQTFSNYCVTDCTVGLSNVAGPNEIESRGSIGLGIFPDGSNSDAPDTMAHELGHALGRDHSPCGGATSIDRHFPYKDGKIGVWGFDSLNHNLLDPTAYGDVMGYCSPDWISDYTYRAIFERIQYVNAGVTGAQALRSQVAASVYRRVLVGADGQLRWGSRFTPSQGPRGEARDVTLLTEDGAAIGSTVGYFQPFSDARGGFLVVPESSLDASDGVAVIRVGAAELSLSAPMP